MKFPFLQHSSPPVKRRRFLAGAASTLLLLIMAPSASAALNTPIIRQSSAIDSFIRPDGTLLVGRNFGSASAVTRNGVTFSAAGTSGNPSGVNWSAVGASVDSNLGGFIAVDPLFFSEIYGASPVTLTCSNLNAARVYVVQIMHGEPRACCAGVFATNDFVTSAGTLAVPAFTIGNAIQGENPPNLLDRAIVEVELTGITNFTYRMRNGANRGPSIAGFQVRDITPQLGPTVVTQIPPAGAAVPSLRTVEVLFSTAVTNVRASDLLVDGSPAANVSQVDATQYVWEFPQPATGAVQIAFSLSQGIADLTGTPFAGGNWSYTLITNPAVLPVLNEFMAANKTTRKDIYGNYSDWIEIYNPNPAASFNLLGYSLTGNRLNLTNWTFPAIIMAPRSYLLVYADGSTAVPVAGQELHASFKLNKDGDYLALVAPDGATIVQEFAPVFPPQNNDISYGFISPGILDYMEQPTPGAANVSTRLVQPVDFSEPSRAFVDSFSLVLTSATPGATIYYTTNGAVPTTNSLIYSAPLPVTATKQIRARAAKPGLASSTVQTRAYVQLDASARSFSSDLPLIIMDSFGAPIGQSAVQPVYLMTFEPDAVTGRATLTNPPTLSMRAGLRYRGQSSGGFPKHQFKLETWNEDDADKDVPLLGLPSESDWVLNGDYVDESIIRNPMVYDFGREIGLEAPRSRFSEVFLHTSGNVLRGTLSDSPTTSYYGVLSVMEFIKIAKNRVNAGKLVATDNTEPNITGGYILRFEKDATQGPVLSGWRTLEVADPNAPLPTPQQLAWISSYMNTFRSVVMSPNWRNPTNGFRSYIDEDSVIHYMLINELTHAQDAYVRSSYLWKARGDKLVEGPLWDYNLSFGISCCFDSWRTNNWTYTTNPSAEPYWNILESDRTTPNGAFPMYERLLADSDFSQRWVDRYQELRRTSLRQDQWNRRVDRYAAQVLESQARNFTRWQTLGSVTTGFQSGLANFMNIATETWPIHIQHIKNWSQGRLLWMDAQFPAPVQFSLGSGIVPAGTSLRLTNGGSLSIYYTLDGTDPRASGGGPSPSATQLAGSTLILNDSRTVIARSFGITNKYGVTNWSGPTMAHFYVNSVPANATNFAITEIHYHPQGPTVAELLVNTNFTDEDFEFVELRNISTNIVDLYQVRFTNGIQFNFSTGSVALLAPAQYVVLVRNAAAFQARYGSGKPVAGVYEGRLNNAGNHLTLVDYLDGVIADFSYPTTQHPATDGQGFSLQAVNEYAAVADVGNPSYWRPSWRYGGTPGAPDPQLAIARVVINEVMTHPFPPDQDAIELFNPGPGLAEIGDWWLTDDPSLPQKYRIPPGTSIPSGGYVVFSESQFNSLPGTPGSFGLSSQGESLWLFSADVAGDLTGYATSFTFGPSKQGSTFGRYVTSDGQEQFPTQLTPTLGTSNSGPRVGPVVINEIHYHPPANTDEFLELLNLTDTPVPLFQGEPGNPTNSWQINGLSYTLPLGVILPAHGRLLLVNDASNSFRTRWNVPAAVAIFQYPGSLQDSGEQLELLAPNLPSTNGILYYAMDTVRYNDREPWPLAADGAGASLQRITPGEYGDDSINWTAASPTPGAHGLTGTPPVITSQPVSRTSATFGLAAFSVNASGTEPLFYQWRANGANLDGATNRTLILTNLQLSDAGSYQAAVFNAAGSTESSNALLAVIAISTIPSGYESGIPGSPSITSHPQNQTVLGGAGRSTLFTVAVSGDGPRSFRWLFGSSAIPNATSDSLILNDIQVGQQGNYRCVVFNGISFASSSNAFLTVLQPAVITQSPTNIDVRVRPDPGVDVAPNTNAIFRIAATTLNPPLTFQWRMNGTNLLPSLRYSNIYATTLIISNVTMADFGDYSCALTDGAGTLVSPSATLYPLVRPTILIPLLNQTQTVVAGSSFPVSAVLGNGWPPPFGYQWRAGSTVVNFLSDSSKTNFFVYPSNNIASGAVTGATYRVVVTNRASTNLTISVPFYITTLADTEREGIPDSVENALGLDPNNATDAVLDQDSDGISNRAEYRAGTDPADPASYLRIEQSILPGAATLRFAAVSNRTYTIQFSDLLPTPSWSKLSDFVALPTNRIEVVADPSWTTNRFYRVGTPRQP